MFEGQENDIEHNKLSSQREGKFPEGKRQATDPNAMPLAEFIAEVMHILATQPKANEILVEKVYPHRFAGDFNTKKFDSFFEQFNVAMAGR